MMNLCSPKSVAELLSFYGLKPSKSLGQNFLVDGNYLDKIVQAAAVDAADTVLEIGPGLGTLTRALAERGASVLAIEKDRHLQPLLAETLRDLSVNLIWGDALDVDYCSLLQGASNPKVVANLPYYITTPLIIGLLSSGVPWKSLVFLVQREVVERVSARPGTKSYGMLSIVAQYYTCPSLIAVVPGRAFVPAPKAVSAVLRLLPFDHASYGLLTKPAVLFRVAKAALGQRRKTLQNALTSAFSLPRVELAELLTGMHLSLDRRGETLSVAELVQLTNCLWLRWPELISG